MVRDEEIQFDAGKATENVRADNHKKDRKEKQGQEWRREKGGRSRERGKEETENRKGRTSK